MRHLNKGRKLGRTAAHRKATMSAMCVALIKHHRIVTTTPKAKELRRYVEPIITKAKTDSTHTRSQVFAFLRDKEAVTELFEMVIPAVGERAGGYTRVVKMGRRMGDGAETSVIELVDFNDVRPDGKSAGRKKTRRAGSRKKKSTDTVEEASVKVAEVNSEASAKDEESKEA